MHTTSREGFLGFNALAAKMYHTMYTRLSKKISYVLRHNPGYYALTLDAEGWVAVDDLLEALRDDREEWQNLSEDDLAEMIAQADKPRHEMRDGKFRARHGHSTPAKVIQERAKPPALLYHGTNDRVLDAILRNGLRPMNRQYVHFAADPDTAIDVGERRQGKTILLTIRAGEAHRAGVAFYKSSEAVWLADELPPEFIDAPDDEA